MPRQLRSLEARVNPRPKTLTPGPRAMPCTCAPHPDRLGRLGSSSDHPTSNPGLGCGNFEPVILGPTPEPQIQTPMGRPDIATEA